MKRGIWKWKLAQGVGVVLALVIAWWGWVNYNLRHTTQKEIEIQTKNRATLRKALEASLSKYKADHKAVQKD